MISEKITTCIYNDNIYCPYECIGEECYEYPKQKQATLYGVQSIGQEPEQLNLFSEVNNGKKEK